MATSGQSVPSYYAYTEFNNYGNTIGGNVPIPQLTSQTSSAVLVMTSGTVDAGYGTKTLTFHAEGGSNGLSSDGWAGDGGKYIRWYAMVNGVNVGLIASLGNNVNGSGDLAYTFSTPQQTFPDLRIYCEARGIYAYGVNGAYTSHSYAGWSVATVSWTAVPVGKTVKMVI